jgi:hypothetical protein
MATNFPASLDTLTNPTSSDSLSSPSHSAQHANVNDAVEALQAKVGADSSAVTTSLDYKVAQLEAISHGKILQVVSTTKSDTFSGAVASGASLNITGLSATITPSATSSTILVMAIVNGTRITSDVPNIPIAVTRGGTLVGVGDAAGSRTRVGGIHFTFTGNNTSMGNAQVVFMDSPASISALTYQVVLRGVASTGCTFAVNRNSADGDAVGHPRSISTLTLMEVSA